MAFREVLVVEMGLGACWRMVGLAIMAAWRFLLVYETWWAVCGGGALLNFLGSGGWWGRCVWVAGVLLYK